MAKKHICKKCGGQTFSVTAHVAQEWAVNESGDWIETITDCTDIVARPSDDDVWTCMRCNSDETMILEDNEFPVIITEADKVKYGRLMQAKHVDFNKEDIPAPYSTVKSWTTTCVDGNGVEYEVDVKVCSGDRGESLWCEAVLFQNGSEVQCAEAEDTLGTVWEFSVDGYVMKIVPVFVDQTDNSQDIVHRISINTKPEFFDGSLKYFWCVLGQDTTGKRKEYNCGHGWADSVADAAKAAERHYKERVEQQ